jgi:carbonyl reductase 1
VSQGPTTQMPPTLANVLVTGANRGLGQEVCSLLLGLGGYRVIAAARVWSGESRSTLTSSSSSSSSAIEFISLDVSDALSRAAARSSLQSILGEENKLSVLVNNAGVYHEGEWSKSVVEESLATNAIGPLRFATELLPLFAVGASHVVNVSSGYGKLEHTSPSYRAALAAAKTVDELEAASSFRADDEYGSTYVAAYKLSKATLNRGTQILAEQWAGRVRVTSVDPGWCRTRMGGKSAPRSQRDGADTIFKAVVSQSGTGKFLGPDGEPTGW